MEFIHVHSPVLIDPVIEFLDIQPDDIVLDCTVGFGGHAALLLPLLGEKGRYIGLDRDEAAWAFCRERFADNPKFEAIHTTFADFKSVLDRLGLPHITKCLVDLGISSFQLDHPERGFSFLTDAPLDMRMDAQAKLDAATILNTYPPTELSRIFIEFGELRNPAKLVDTIFDTRKKLRYATTFQLVDTIKKSFFFKNSRPFYMKTCSQVFQALRIEVNGELDQLNRCLTQLTDSLARGGRAAFISFHSTEDRIIKYFVKARPDTLARVTKKAISATQTEIRANSRSKSAKVRVFEKRC